MTNTGTYPQGDFWNGHPRINGIAWGFQIEDDGDPGHTFTVIHDVFNPSGSKDEKRVETYHTTLVIQRVSGYSISMVHKSTSVVDHAKWLVDMINEIAEWRTPPVDFVERVTTILNGIETDWDPKLKV